MNRYSSGEAIILENRRIGEIHRGVSLFTPDSGVVRAIAYGAYSHKGSLRGVTVPFVHGTVWLYHEPARSRIKLTDIDVIHMFHEIREDLLRFYSAGLWSEVVLRSFGGGEAACELFDLFREALQILCSCNEGTTRRLSAQFQLRFLALAGAPVDPEHIRKPAIRRFVEAAYASDLYEAIRIAIDDEEMRGIQRALYRRLERTVEGELRTVRSAGGLL